MMRSPYTIITFLVLLISLPGCDLADIGPYYNLGTFTSRAIAEHKALIYLADNYDELSNSKSEGVAFMFSQPNPVGGPELKLRHILWYNKVNQTIGIEADPGSGTRCYWSNIDQATLTQLVSKSQGLSQADSLGKANGVSYFQCVGN